MIPTLIGVTLVVFAVINLAPGSPVEQKLQQLRFGGGMGTAGGEAKGGNTYSYTNCRIKSGPTGPTTSAEGRLGSRTYAFEAEGFRIG